MRSFPLFQSLLIATTFLSAAARTGMDYTPNDTQATPQRLRQSNHSSGKPRHHTYMRRTAERKHSSKATSEIVSMSMTTDDGYGDSGTTPAPAVFEETPAPTVTDDIGPVVSEETGEAEKNFGPIGVSVDVGGDNNVVTASIQIVQGGGSIDVSSEDVESDGDDEEEGDYEEESDDDDGDDQLDDVIYDDYPVDDGWDDHDDAYGSVSMSMTTDDSTDDGYGGTASDDGSTYTTDDAPTTDDRYSSNAVEVETEVVADDNLGGDDQYAKLTQDDGETAEDDSTNVDSTDDGYIDDNLDYFDDDFVVDLPSEEDLKVV